MALSLFSSTQPPQSLLNANSTTTGNYASLTGSLTGSTAILNMNVGPIGSPSSVPATPNTIQQMLTPGGMSANRSETLHLLSQPGTTPPAADSNALVNLSNDAYRYGGDGEISSVTGDTLVNPSTGYGRELGEPATDDNIASIFLSTQYPTDYTNVNASATGDILNAYSRFFLQGVQESQSEKLQVVETFTDYYAFFYGKRPPIYNYRGTLLNDENYKWTNDLMFFYENFFRGSQTVALGAQAYISYSGRLVSGFLINLQIAENADLYKGAQFSFDVLVINHRQLYFSADIADVIESAQQALSAQKAAILAQTSAINNSIAPGKAVLTALQVTSGQQPASTASAAGEIKPVTPTSLVTTL